MKAGQGRRAGRTSWLLLAVWLLAAAAQAATVRAQVQPAKARPNQMVTYTITVQDGQVDNLPNLRLPLQIGQASEVSTARQFSLINGRQSQTMRLSWGVVASEPGEFVIPPQEVQVNGEVVSTNEVQLVVEQGGGPAAAAAGEDGNAPILQIELGKKEIYQGEVMPVTCSLYVPRQTPLRRLGLIDIEKSDFAIARFPQQSEQTMTVIDGVGYIVLTFRSTLSSLRTGELKVGPASMEILVEVPSEAEQRRPNLFPPGFPSGFFGVPSEPRKVVVKSQQVSLTVLPLPAEGRPPGFTGAVGDFALSATASPTELTVGDPVAVELMIEGTGNFDALTTPALTAPGGWKSYPAKRYNIEGQLDQNQTPTLERKIGYSQVFIPEAVHAALPAFETSFFSPAKKQYVTLRTEPIPLNMKPAPVAATGPAAASAGAVELAPPPAVDPQADITDIVMHAPAQAHWLAAGGAPWSQRRDFWALQAVPVALLLLAVAFAAGRRRREALQAGRAGELRAAWAAVGEAGADDAEFLRRSAQLIQTAQGAEPVRDAELQAILDRYQASNFTAGPARPLTAQERRSIQQTLARLFKQALTRVALLSLLLLPALAGAQTPAAPDSADQVYREAVAELGKGNFTRAQYLAESLTKRRPPQLSPEVFELIGHARYRQDDPGRAALWYQRAALVDGRSPELRQNLRHLHERLRFLSFDRDDTLAQWSCRLTANEWTLLAAAGFWLVLLSVAWRVWSRRRRAFWPVLISLLGLLLAVPATTLAVLRPSAQQRVRAMVVVTLPEVRAYTAPTVTAGTVIDLPPGSQVRVLETRGAWLYVEIPERPESLRGWVEAAATAPLWPWEEALLP